MDDVTDERTAREHDASPASRAWKSHKRSVLLLIATENGY